MPRSMLRSRDLFGHHLKTLCAMLSHSHNMLGEHSTAPSRSRAAPWFLHSPLASIIAGLGDAIGRTHSSLYSRCDDGILEPPLPTFLHWQTSPKWTTCALKFVMPKGRRRSVLDSKEGSKVNRRLNGTAKSERALLMLFKSGRHRLELEMCRRARWLR